MKSLELFINKFIVRRSSRYCDIFGCMPRIKSSAVIQSVIDAKKGSKELKERYSEEWRDGFMIGLLSAQHTLEINAYRHSLLRHIRHHILKYLKSIKVSIVKVWWVYTYGVFFSPVAGKPAKFLKRFYERIGLKKAMCKLYGYKYGGGETRPPIRREKK